MATLLQILQAIAALAVTLGLIGLTAVGLRRFGPDVIARFQGPAKERRLALLETLVLDPTRRLVLVRLDGEERLILIGEGRMLETLKPPAPARARKTPAKEIAQ
ncbi:MAG: flagellar biosynthetic protein FliO [Caulobacter sp.]|nr:flagellar biosynthetic protein FliO [Caulobacter sp.]